MTQKQGNTTKTAPPKPRVPNLRNNRVPFRRPVRPRPRPPGKVPGIANSSLQWLTPEMACLLLGTHCTLPKPKKPWDGENGRERTIYLARCEFKAEKRRISTGEITKKISSHTVLTVFGPVKDLITITQPLRSHSEAVFFKTVGTDIKGNDSISTSLILITSPIADFQWKITEINISLKRADGEKDPPPPVTKPIGNTVTQPPRPTNPTPRTVKQPPRGTTIKPPKPPRSPNKPQDPPETKDPKPPEIDDFPPPETTESQPVTPPRPVLPPQGTQTKPTIKPRTPTKPRKPQTHPGKSVPKPFIRPGTTPKTNPKPSRNPRPISVPKPFTRPKPKPNPEPQPSKNPQPDTTPARTPRPRPTPTPRPQPVRQPKPQTTPKTPPQKFPFLPPGAIPKIDPTRIPIPAPKKNPQPKPNLIKVPKPTTPVINKPNLNKPKIELEEPTVCDPCLRKIQKGVNNNQTQITNIQNIIQQQNPATDTKAIEKKLNKICELLEVDLQGKVTSKKCPQEPDAEDKTYSFSGKGLLGIKEQISALENLVNDVKEEVCEIDVSTTIPDWWNLKVVNRPPTLSLLLGLKNDNGTIARANTVINIPHWKNPRIDKKPPIDFFRKGNRQGIYTLKDGSKIIVNCISDKEALRILNLLDKYVDPKFRTDHKHVSPRLGAPIKSGKVYPKYGKYYKEDLNKTIMAPEWSVKYET
ncbi:MAG: hypothetical protein QNJ64_12465 [Crocosphaera sp.]|nr:hypothetical protein [Crocosphaera sp.]